MKLGDAEKQWQRAIPLLTAAKVMRRHLNRRFCMLAAFGAAGTLGWCVLHRCCHR
jgi:hypothetical protein